MLPALRRGRHAAARALGSGPLATGFSAGFFFFGLNLQTLPSPPSTERLWEGGGMTTMAEGTPQGGIDDIVGGMRGMMADSQARSSFYG